MEEYSKPALSFSEQADLLLRRGLIADKALLISRLSDVNYYRLRVVSQFGKINLIILRIILL